MPPLGAPTACAMLSTHQGAHTPFGVLGGRCALGWAGGTQPLSARAGTHAAGGLQPHRLPRLHAGGFVWAATRAMTRGRRVNTGCRTGSKVQCGQPGTAQGGGACRALSLCGAHPVCWTRCPRLCAGSPTALSSEPARGTFGSAMAPGCEGVLAGTGCSCPGTCQVTGCLPSAHPSKRPLLAAAVGAAGAQSTTHYQPHSPTSSGCSHQGAGHGQPRWGDRAIPQGLPQSRAAPWKGSALGQQLPPCHSHFQPCPGEAQPSCIVPTIIPASTPHPTWRRPKGSQTPSAGRVGAAATRLSTPGSGTAAMAAGPSAGRRG